MTPKIIWETGIEVFKIEVTSSEAAPQTSEV